jgi:ComF family protein
MTSWPLSTLAAWPARLASPLWIDAALALIFAPACALCDRVLDAPSQGPVCKTCWGTVCPFQACACARCGLPLSPQHESSPRAAVDRCRRCRRGRGAVDRARAIGDYDGALRDLIHAFKYGGRRRIAVGLGALLRRHGEELLVDAEVVVPVPLHRSRERQRGFNQSALLAGTLGLPVARALRRQRATPSQATLPATRRQANVRDAFAPGRDSAEVANRVVVLVDDVCTTGATLNACADVLKRQGAREVRALTVARVVPKRR